MGISADIQAVFVPIQATAARRSIPEDEAPVWTYAEARRWLWQNVDPLDMEAIVQRNAPLPPMMRFIAVLYWVGHEKLRADLRKDWRGDGA